MAGEDPGLLGNLPRTRPGVRSEKRGERAAEVRPEPASSSASEGSATADGPVGEAVRTAVGAAQAGLRIADGLTREVLRRLPRP